MEKSSERPMPAAKQLKIYNLKSLFEIYNFYEQYLDLELGKNFSRITVGTHGQIHESLLLLLSELL